MNNLEAIVLGIVEGLTEFLPVSSTGHMIITQALLGVQETSFNKVFLINIQFGAIIAVLVMYLERFFQSLKFYKSLAVAFLPAAVIGFTLNDFIDSLLQSVPVVALMLILGGIVMIWADRYFKHKNVVVSEEELQDNHEEHTVPGISQSFVIGLSQCFALIPGVSRSAATIIGGLTQQLNFKEAAEYSFFLAVPTIFAAAAYKTLKGFQFIKGTDITALVIGNITSFIVAIIAIKYFIRILNKYGLSIFGYYRILVGVVILVCIYVLHIPLQIMK